VHGTACHIRDSPADGHVRARPGRGISEAMC
jgi:hypothetical protein